jgi:predicted ThiF/HesA family dinucleotide-utilizing enzyme
MHTIGRMLRVFFLNAVSRDNLSLQVELLAFVRAAGGHTAPLVSIVANHIAKHEAK